MAEYTCANVILTSFIDVPSLVRLLVLFHSSVCWLVALAWCCWGGFCPGWSWLPCCVQPLFSPIFQWVVGVLLHCLPADWCYQQTVSSRPPMDNDNSRLAMIYLFINSTLVHGPGFRHWIYVCLYAVWFVHDVWLDEAIVLFSDSSSCPRRSERVASLLKKIKAKREVKAETLDENDSSVPVAADPVTSVNVPSTQHADNFDTLLKQWVLLQL